MYFPKSQIETNLYSNGDLSVLKTGVLYTGFYWSTSTGKYYAGKTPDDPFSNIELTLTSVKAASNISLLEPNLGEEQPFYVYNLQNLNYLRLKGLTNTSPPRSPRYTPPNPTLDDYEVGEFDRYFCKKVNEFIFIEISAEDYAKLKNEDETIAFNLYDPFILPWVISGDKEKVALENKNTVLYKELRENFRGLDFYLKSNYIQFYGLYTPGGEFLLPNGEDYIGLYHVHPGTGPMVGVRHVPYSHARLTPISASLSISEPESQQIQSSPPVSSQPSNIYNGSSNTSGGY